MSDKYGSAEIIESLESELGQTVDIGGLNYPAIVGSPNTNKTLDIGGYSVGSAVEVVIRCGLFDTPPALKSILTFNSRDYLINQIVIAQDSSCYVLSCDDADKDA